MNISLRGVTKRFGATVAVDTLSLEIRQGELVSVVGGSGCGKTTTLRMIAGFERPDAGEIAFDGRVVNDVPPRKRGVGIVFQSYALFPTMTVAENVAFGLRVARWREAQIRERVAEMLELTKLGGLEGRYANQLSGGQQQRVALARALVNRPELLLLDEPLSALDANLRKEMQSELKSLQREVGITFLFVTHDQEEAMALSDRIALLRNGALEQVASPREIYARPATAYAAQFIGHTNLLRADIRDGIADCGAFQFSCSRSNGTAIFSLRPEAISLATDSLRIADPVRFSASIRQQIYSGATELLELQTATNLVLRARIASRAQLSASRDFVFSASDAVAVNE